jgi:serine/threonine-protein kinase RsbW
VTDSHPAGAVVLDIAADPALVSTARVLVCCLAASRRELSAEQLDDLKLAVSEACANAINAYGSEVDAGRVLVSWSEDDDRLEVRVTDRGPGYDPAQALPSDSGGLGVKLIQILVDEARWEPGTPGTTVLMSMACPRSGSEQD